MVEPQRDKYGRFISTNQSASEANIMTGNRWEITLPKTRIHTLEELLNYCEVDLGIWEVERFIVNKWEMGHKDKLGVAQVEPLYQVKAFLKKKVVIVDAQNEIEELKELAKQNFRVPQKRIKDCQVRIPSGNMLEINLPDAHFGKLSWSVETGFGNYDTKIAEATYMSAFHTLLNRVNGYNFDEVLFVVGNDILNSDNPEGTTTSGTSVSNDTRYHKTFAKVRTTIVECIERLRLIAKVKVVMVSGNHDKLAVWHLGDSLECYFHKYDDVQIDNSPKYRKYHQFGKVMLGFTHGDKGKRLDYPLLMATEQSELFGQTKFREMHTGHYHVTKLEEQHGVRVRILPALCSPDDWLAENGMVGNLRNGEAYVWNKNEGLIAQFYYNADADENLVNK